MSAPMAHLNRRSEDTDDGQRHRVLEAVEDTWSKVLARWVLPGLVALLIGVVTWVGREALDQIKQQGVDIRTQGDDIVQVKSDVRVMATRLDEGIVRQVNSNTQKIDEHERRLQVLERTVKTP